ncbi:hypothetical protein BH18VER1_BH18VER1_12750 [soil metagenome]
MTNKAALALTGCLFLGLSVTARAGGIVDETTEQTFAVGANPTLTVRNTDGRVLVYGSAENQIVVKTYKRTFSKERLGKIDASVSLVGDDMTIETKIPPAERKLLADRSGTVEYTVLVPQHCAVRVDQSQGEMHFEGLLGPRVEGHQINGRINVRSCFAPTEITIEAGGIDVVANWWEMSPFAMSLAVKRGDVTLALPPMAAVRLDLATQSGHIRNQLQKQAATGGNVQQLNTVIGSASGAEIKVRVSNGNIRLRKAY